MIDTPFESWCANVAHIIKDRGRRPGENAADFICRIYGPKAYTAFVDDLPAQTFAETRGPK